MAEFIKLETDNGKSLKLSRKHLMYKTDCESNGIFFEKISILVIEKFLMPNVESPVFAEEVQLGDCVYAFDEVIEIYRAHRAYPRVKQIRPLRFFCMGRRICSSQFSNLFRDNYLISFFKCGLISFHLILF